LYKHIYISNHTFPTLTIFISSHSLFSFPFLCQTLRIIRVVIHACRPTNTYESVSQVLTLTLTLTLVLQKSKKSNSQAPLPVHPIPAHCPHSAITVPVLLAVVVVLFELVVVVALVVAFVLELVVDVVFALLAVVVTDVPLFLTVKIAISCNASVAETLVPVPDAPV
jgi:hypothetical protein